MSVPNPSSTQPKIYQKLVLRTLMLVIVLGALFMGFQYYEGTKNDLGGMAKTDTVGQIAAINYLDEGAQAVIFKPDGTVVKDSGYKPLSTDRDLTWRPDGNFLFFVSDRIEKTVQVFRWSPAQSSAEARTFGTRGRSNPSFPAEDLPDANDTALITSGGFVLEYNPKDRSTRQILPPLGREIVQGGSDEEKGSDSQFSGTYGKIGTSFKLAKWCKAKKWIAGIMKRDSGEVLVLQDMTPVVSKGADGKDAESYKSPMVVAAGEHIEMAINPKDGTVVYAIQGFAFPDPEKVPAQFIKGNKILLPFHHGIFTVDPDKGQAPPIVFHKDDKVSFGGIAISPDGSSLVTTVGPFSDSSHHPQGLVTMPVQPNGASAGAPLLKGEIYEPSWSPGGDKITFARRDPDGKRSIFTINKDGSNERKVSDGKGNYGTPKFSPQVASAATK